MSRCVVLAVLVLGVCAAPAGAASVTWTAGDAPPADPDQTCAGGCRPSQLEVVDGGAERNDLALSREGENVVVRDAATPLVAGSGCTGRPDGSVSCPVAESIVVRAGAGDDAVNALAARVDGGEGNDTLTGQFVEGGAGDDALTGTPADDTLAGGDGADTIDALGGDDTVTDVEAVLVADRLEGGPGVDTLSFAGRTPSVRVDLGSTTQSGGSADEDNVVGGFESAVGGDGADDLLGPTTAVTDADLVLVGGPGNDRLIARSPTATRLRGEAGDDELLGGAAAETFEGDGGDDRVSAAGGNDTIQGGDGGDQLDGEWGHDTISGGDDADVIGGGSGRDRLSGDRGLDDIAGDADNDVLRGGASTDDLVGGLGRDRLFGGSAGDRMDGGLDNDVLVGGKGRDRMLGAEGNDRLRARDGERDRMLDCGADGDTATIDRDETVLNCERTRRPARVQASR